METWFLLTKSWDLDNLPGYEGSCTWLYCRWWLICYYHLRWSMTDHFCVKDCSMDISEGTNKSVFHDDYDL